ncbi:hypothetical protein DC31_07970 [Microbacterium sp. CH12i]|uniref:hypothetical protein n=1 Tax=Microbacterium sp. CH12i TaxID=1479651 RepID=UPI000461D894|nr:hypothetical protein [Microbacterium sp. CH12i]KDA06893.1 hypothetical protein DC31_07970 [Microbacterium sp. CH12i]
MLTILASTGRVLLRHWPVMLAWFLAGRLVHYVGIEVAGYVGAWSSVGGFLILPLAILARLISFVAMFLVIRDGLRELQGIAPVPDAAAERRRTFVNTLLASILPFFAIYTAWGMLRDDVVDYTTKALEVNSGVRFQALVDGVELPDLEFANELSLNMTTALIIVGAYAGRWAWKRWSAKLPKALSLVAVYFEAVWVCFSLFLIRIAFDAVGGWADTRVGMQWVIQLRAWVGEQLRPVAWIWDGLEWFIGEVAGLLAEPLAWLAIAGVIYGQAIAAEKPWTNHRLFTRSQERLKWVPSRARRILRELGADFTGRFTPILNAIGLMWRAGPVLIASFVLLYTVVLAGHGLLEFVIVRLLGPHDLFEFWGVADVLIALVASLIFEPVRISLVAAAYDRALGAQRRHMDAVDAVAPTDAAAEQSAQGSIENRAKYGIASVGETSTQNGPSASSGTPNASMSS